MDVEFKDIVSRVNAKPGRSRLEPYGELVEELRSKGFTCRDIAALLKEKCQFRTSKTAVNNFVRAQARKRRNAVRKLSRSESGSPPTCKPLPQYSAQTQSDDEIRKKIAEKKARKPAPEPAPDGFHYDPDQPLRLINPDKRNSYD